MQLSGQELIPVSPEKIWQALNDPVLLQRLIPNCTRFTQHQPGDYTAEIMVKLGPLKPVFTGILKVSDADPPHRYRLDASGTGGVSRLARATALVRLQADPGGTLLSYEADFALGGRLAQMAAPFLNRSVDHLNTAFFARLRNLIMEYPMTEPSPPSSSADINPSADDTHHSSTVAIGAATPPALASETIANSNEPAINVNLETPVILPDDAEALDVVTAETRALPPWIWVGGLILLLLMIVGLALQA